MTEQQAVDIVRKEKAYMDSHAGRSQSEAFEMAIKALEKQIPKKPIDKIMFLECPACGDVGILDCAYCSVCGQKLDWSDEE